VTDCDVAQGKVKIDKARVVARDKDRTKTSEDRIIELCPRALHVLKRHLALRARLKLEGKINRTRSTNLSITHKFLAVAVGCK